MNDRDRGIEAIRMYYDFSFANFREVYKLIDFGYFVDSLDYKNKSFIEGLGLGINFNLKDGTFDLGDVQDSMESLAKILKGKIPSDMNKFRSAIVQEARKIKASMFYNATIDSVGDIVNGAVYIGKETMTASKSILSLAPYAKWILLGGGALAILYYGKTFKMIAERAMKRIR